MSLLFIWVEDKQMPKKEFSLMMLEQDLVIILETVRIIAIALSPVTPSLSWRIYAQLGYSRDQFDAATWVSLSILHTHIHTNSVIVFDLSCFAL